MPDVNNNTVWSELIQTPQTLDYYRTLRFHDKNKEQIIQYFGLTDGKTIVDIGCGPGTLTRKLAEWLSKDTEIIGIDRDINFIKYAKTKAKKNNLLNLSYIEGDALDLPLDDNCIDNVISYTVIEHLPHEQFLKEQIRVCRNNGCIAVGFVQSNKNFSQSSGLLPTATAKENELWQKLSCNADEIDKKLDVSAYNPDVLKLIRLMDYLGIKDIQLNILSLTVCIDDARITKQEKMQIFELELSQNIDIINTQQKHLKNLSETEYDQLLSLVNQRFADLKEQGKSDKKTWDYSVITNIVISGCVTKS